MKPPHIPKPVARGQASGDNPPGRATIRAFPNTADIGIGVECSRRAAEDQALQVAASAEGGVCPKFVVPRVDSGGSQPGRPAEQGGDPNHECKNDDELPVSL